MSLRPAWVDPQGGPITGNEGGPMSLAKPAASWSHVTGKRHRTPMFLDSDCADAASVENSDRLPGTHRRYASSKERRLMSQCRGVSMFQASRTFGQTSRIFGQN